MTTNHCWMLGLVWHHDGDLWVVPMGGTGTCHPCEVHHRSWDDPNMSHPTQTFLGSKPASALELALHYATGKPSAGATGGDVCLVSLVFTIKLLKSGCFYSFFPPILL